MLILDSVIPVFILIAFGYIFKRRGFINDSVENFLNNLAYYLVLPCMIFASIYKLPFQELFSARSIAGLYLTAVIIFGLSALFSIPLKPAKRGAFVTSAFRSNIAYIGFPIVLNLYGQEGLGKIAVITGFMAPFIITLAIIYLNYLDGHEKADSPVSIIYKDPLIITSIVSVIISYYGIKIPAFLFNTADMFSSMGSPLILMAVGAGLKFSSIRSDRVLLSFVTVIKLMLMPLAAYFVFKFLIPVHDTMLFNISVLTVSFPTALSNYVLVKKYKSDHEFSAAAITVTTVLSLISISAWIWFLTR